MATLSQIKAMHLADKVQGFDAAQFNGRQLVRILASNNPDQWRNYTPNMLRDRATRMVKAAEAGTLSDEDSRAMGLLGLAVLRHIAEEQ